MPRTTKKTSVSLLQRFKSQMDDDQSYLTLIMGLLIVLIAGVLVFNYFKQNKPDLGSSAQTEQIDVSPNDLPGKYTVKENDTLFSIAQTYYNDGYKFTSIAEENKLTNVDSIEAGQVLEIPKLEASETASIDNGTGGAIDQTIWGEKVEEDTYTVVEGDWLSKIAGRAYGDVMAFDKIAKANNIADPNIIEPGTVLQIPR
ncbi:MAG: LysM peptidoglycan-binding domain-containing protein [Candidatus Daviesbacteria bacterium]|nr:LysM peptidoglycan-binding domain-containing protein [Candidatus Daviesbacteria bacterium]